MIKIAIYGKAKTGKNTVANLIANQLENYREEVFITAFADPIKDLIVNTFQFENARELLFGKSELRNEIVGSSNFSYRDLLCDIGELFKKYDSNVWIKKTFDLIDKRIKEDDLFYSYVGQNYISYDLNYMPHKLVGIIISDMRFKSEYNAVNERNFFTIKLVRPDNDYFHNHISETELEILPDTSFDYCLRNDGPLSQLEPKIKEIISLAKEKCQSQ